MIETVEIPADHLPSLRRRLNPIWWLQNGFDGWGAPAWNNGEPYLPGISNQLHRDVIWWFRNPAANFVEYVIGIRGRAYTVVGPAPVMLTTYRDAVPPRTGWKWAILRCGWLQLPFISFAGRHVEFYLGWRPYIGGFGVKLLWKRKAVTA